jgi:homoserine/homoserine lactone efflux protein
VLRGALTNATNPKGIVFMVAVLPQFIDPKQPLALQLAILLVTTLAVDSVVMHGYAFLASRLRALMPAA